MLKRWRQSLHLEPPRGWLNDPNGLCWFGGLYHVFFQYCPDSPAGEGKKCWGHYESPDLFHWTFTGTVLRPDTPQDRDGVYSGSAVVADGKMRLFYTGNVKHPGNYDYTSAGREANVLRVDTPDGSEMGKKEPLLTNADYPADCSCHVRDPKLWYEGGVWKMLLGERSRKGVGGALLYESTDLEGWTLAARIEPDRAFGYMWECPDYLPLGHEQLLAVCPQGLPHGETQNQNVFQSGYFPVTGAVSEGKLGPFTEWDMGFDFYAPQSFLAPDGRRLLIGWMGLPDAPYQNPTAALGWQHCLTVPRQVFLDDTDRVCQLPAREVIVSAGPSVTVAPGSTVSLDAPFAVEAAPAGSFSLELAGGLSLSWDADRGICSLNFADTALSGGRTRRLAKLPACRNLLVLVDASSVEIFLDGGAVAMATRFYPPEGEISVTIENTDARLCPLAPMTFAGLDRK